MRFDPLSIKGVVVVSIDRLPDRRGFFARTHCSQEFEEFGLPTNFVQSSISFNHRKGTIRGIHFQWPPSSEGKLVRCVRGRVHDVLLDLRPQSPTYLMHDTVILDSEDHNAVYVPPGVAHGFQTLEDKSEVHYQMTDYYAPNLSSGFRWNDAAFGISWPLPVSDISDQDREYQNFNRLQFENELHRRIIPGSNTFVTDAVG